MKTGNILNRLFSKHIFIHHSRTISERLIDGLISFLMDKADVDVKDIGQNFLTLISKEMLKKIPIYLYTIFFND
jgi:hypothetical protein